MQLTFRRISHALAALAACVCGVLVACSNGDATGATGDVDGGGGRPDAATSTVDGASTTDAGADGGTSVCALTRDHEISCGRSADLTCGVTGFDLWCPLNDQLNSATFDHAELSCLTAANCDPVKRHDCDYRAYGSATLTAAATAMVAAYCQTCEPTDAAGCAKRQTTYDPVAGPSSVSDVFVAAWELSDALIDQIRMKCTGAPLDAGADAGAGVCAKAFSGCSGGVYVDALPACPK